MKVIHLCNTQITGDTILTEDATVLASSSLEVLEITDAVLSSRHLTNGGLVNILNKVGVNLKKLVVEGANIKDIGPLAAHFPNLEILTLDGCYILSDKGILSILDVTGDKLKELDLSNTRISDMGSLTTSLARLEVLKLIGCWESINHPWMEVDRCLMDLLNRTGNCLRSLDISDNNGIRLGDTSYWAFGLPNLKELDMGSCYRLDEWGLISFLNRIGTSLENLNLSDDFLSLSQTGNLTARFPNLKCLNLSWCPNLKEADLVSFLTKIEAPIPVRVIIEQYDGSELHVSRCRIQQLLPYFNIIFNEHDTSDQDRDDYEDSDNYEDSDDH